MLTHLTDYLIAFFHLPRLRLIPFGRMIETSFLNQ